MAQSFDSYFFRVRVHFYYQTICFRYDEFHQLILLLVVRLSDYYHQ
jgi:hypothetical protein